MNLARAWPKTTDPRKLADWMMTHDTSELLRRALATGNYATGRPRSRRDDARAASDDRRQLARLRALARKRGLTVSEALREAVRDYIVRHA